MGIIIPIAIVGIILLMVTRSHAGVRDSGETVGPSDIDDAVKMVEESRADMSALNSVTPPKALAGAGVGEAEWRRYEKGQRNAGLGFVSPSYNLGLYSMGMRALEDVGIVENSKKGDYKGKVVWLGSWVAPLSLEAYLASPKVQYAAFERMTSLHTAAIRARYGDRLGKPLGGTAAWETTPVTMSGLLAVAKQTGLGGLEQWLKVVPANRSKSANAVYQKFNGMF